MIMLPLLIALHHIIRSGWSPGWNRPPLWSYYSTIRRQRTADHPLIGVGMDLLADCGLRDGPWPDPSRTILREGSPGNPTNVGISWLYTS